MELRRAFGLPMIVVRFNPDKCRRDLFFGWKERNGELRPTSSSTWAARLKTLVATIRRLVDDQRVEGQPRRLTRRKMGGY